MALFCNENIEGAVFLLTRDLYSRKGEQFEIGARSQPLFVNAFLTFSGSWQWISVPLFGPGPEREGFAVYAANVVGADRVGVRDASGCVENGPGSRATGTSASQLWQPILVLTVLSPNASRVSPF